jgi:hypothetical protein
VDGGADANGHAPVDDDRITTLLGDEGIAPTRTVLENTGDG